METPVFTPQTLFDDQRLITADEFIAMLEQGLFAHEHVELIQGRIIMLLAQGPQHVSRTAWLNTFFGRRLTQAFGPDQEQVAIQIQATIHLANEEGVEARRSAPEPDFALLRAKPVFTAQRLKTTDVYLVVEVSDTTLSTDLTDKARVYAALGVRVLWVLDLPHRRLHVFEHPDQETALYQEKRTLEQGEVQLDTLPALAPIEVEALFRYM